MPAKAPLSPSKVKDLLTQLGNEILRHRKSLGLSAQVTAEAAGVSRMTLHRIEKGEPSVTLGAYLNVISVLGLWVRLKGSPLDTTNTGPKIQPIDLMPNSTIEVSRYPELKKLAWQIKETHKLSAKEALSIYERNWRHIDKKKLTTKEKQFVKKLLSLFGKERVLV